jgi:hypothetical protein
VSAPGYVILVELERSRPLILAIGINEQEQRRTDDWIDRQPLLRGFLDAALELASATGVAA